MVYNLDLGLGVDSKTLVQRHARRISRLRMLYSLESSSGSDTKSPAFVFPFMAASDPVGPSSGLRLARREHVRFQGAELGTEVLPFRAWGIRQRQNDALFIHSPTCSLMNIAWTFANAIDFVIYL